MTKKDIIFLIEQDRWMMEILQFVKKLKLSDWWIGAGFVRSKVWDFLHEFKERTALPDVDVIYFNKNDFTKEEIRKDTTKSEAKYEALLRKQKEDINWSVTNQARMHVLHNDLPYKTSEEALSRWVETATCIGVRLDEDEKVVLTAPYEVTDLVNLALRKTPEADTKTFNERVAKKNWLNKWPKLKIFNNQ